jgi:hypothetical protein
MKGIVYCVHNNNNSLRVICVVSFFFCSRYQEDCSDSEKSSPTNEGGSGEGLIRNGLWFILTHLLALIIYIRYEVQVECSL